MTDQIFIKPRPGFIVAEIPSAGVLMDESLANTYIANGLAVAAVSKEQAMSDKTQADRAAELELQADLIDAVTAAQQDELPVIGADNGVPKTNHLPKVAKAAVVDEPDVPQKKGK